MYREVEQNVERRNVRSVVDIPVSTTTTREDKDSSLYTTTPPSGGALGHLKPNGLIKRVSGISDYLVLPTRVFMIVFR